MVLLCVHRHHVELYTGLWYRHFIAIKDRRNRLSRCYRNWRRLWLSLASSARARSDAAAAKDAEAEER